MFTPMITLVCLFIAPTHTEVREYSLEEMNAASIEMLYQAPQDEEGLGMVCERLALDDAADLDGSTVEVLK